MFHYFSNSIKTLPSFSTPIDENELQDCLEKLQEQYKTLKQGCDHTSNRSPIISIVIPIYIKENKDTFLTAIRSLLANTNTPPTEIIIILNGKLSTIELINSNIYKMSIKIGLNIFTISYIEDERYKNIKRPQNIFVPKQFGFEQAKGEIVLGTDIDCFFSPNWINAYAEAFQDDPNLLAAYGPVYLHRATEIAGRIITWISTVAKAAKIIIDFPPFAGHNHAIRKEICYKVPNLYKRIIVDCHEIPAILKKSLLLKHDITYFVRCIPDAIVSTCLIRQKMSFVKAIKWFFESAKRNITNFKRIHKLLRTNHELK